MWINIVLTSTVVTIASASCRVNISQVDDFGLEWHSGGLLNPEVLQASTRPISFHCPELHDRKVSQVKCEVGRNQVNCIQGTLLCLGCDITAAMLVQCKYDDNYGPSACGKITLENSRAKQAMRDRWKMDGVRELIIVIMITCAGIVLLLTILGICYIRRKKHYTSLMEASNKAIVVHHTASGGRNYHSTAEPLDRTLPLQHGFSNGGSGSERSTTLPPPRLRDLSSTTTPLHHLNQQHTQVRAATLQHHRSPAQHNRMQPPGYSSEKSFIYTSASQLDGHLSSSSTPLFSPFSHHPVTEPLVSPKVRRAPLPPVRRHEPHSRAPASPGYIPESPISLRRGETAREWDPSPRGDPALEWNPPFPATLPDDAWPPEPVLEKVERSMPLPRTRVGPAIVAPRPPIPSMYDNGEQSPMRRR